MLSFILERQSFSDKKKKKKKAEGVYHHKANIIGNVGKASFL